jgi:uncharacterized cupin superfamily protein
MTETKTIINFADAPFADRGNGESFVFETARLGPMLGLQHLGCTLHSVPAGKRAYPFHRHHVADELFYIVSGTGEYRNGEETLSLKAGDVVGAPAGGKAHQIINTGADELRYLAISNTSSVDVVEYPDSGKMAVAAGVKNQDFKSATFVGMGKIQPAGYYDGEEK